MTLNWEKVHIFISSTFNDMHAERDYLVKRVFPELSDWCEERKLRLVDVDLRWGVTEEDATANANVVQTCLKRIDDCRPFFLCFLGQRYGWIPRSSDVSEETFSNFPGLNRKMENDTSVTELEILHAIVKPFVKNGDGSGGMDHSEHTFFYFREDDYVADLPKEPHQLKRIYSDNEEGESGYREFLLSKMRKLKDEIIPNTGRPIRHYQATWDNQSLTPEIAMPVLCPALLDDNIARWQSEWMKVLNLNEPIVGRELPSDLLAAGNEYNHKLTGGRLGDFRVGDETLHEVVLNDLKEAIAKRFPEHMVIGEKTDLQQEIDQHEAFLFINSEGFIERGHDYEALDNYVNGESDDLLVVAAEGGLGKSMLLSKWVDRCRNLPKQEQDISYHVRFIGKSDRSNTLSGLLYYLLREFQEVSGKIPPIEIPKETQALRSFWREQLLELGKQGKTVIVIDALNQLERGLGDLSWLPMSGLPKNVKIIVSFRTGDQTANELLADLKTNNHVTMASVEPFNNPEHRRQLVRTYLSQYLKELDQNHIEQLISIKGANNPLFLKVVLAELRVFGAFQQLKDRIESDFGDTPVSAFKAVLRRLEQDPSYSIIDPENGVPLLFGFLLNSRQGLSPDELSGLFVRNIPQSDLDMGQVNEAVNLFIRQVKPYLGMREGRYNIFFESLEIAVRERYCSIMPNQVKENRPSREWNGLLADYFLDQSLFKVDGQTKFANVRKLVELPYQQAHANDWDGLEKTLTDYDFLQVKIWAFGPYLLIEDYDEAESSGYDGKLLSLIKGALQLSAGVLSEDPYMFPSQILGRIRDKRNERINALLAKARQSNIAPWLRPISVSLTQPGGLLKRTFIGHTMAAKSLVITADGRYVISGSEDQTIIVWDRIKGIKQDTLVGHTGSVQSLAISPDGHLLISGSSNGGIRVWDLQKGSEIQYFAPQGRNIFDKNIYALAISKDGRKAYSGGASNDILIWNLERLSRHGTLSRPVLGKKGKPHQSGHDDWVRAMTITPNGQYLISGSDDKSLGVWNLHNSQPEFLKGHKDLILAVAVTPDGRKVVSSDVKGEIRVWDLPKGKTIHKLTGHNGMVTALAVSRDGRLVFSGSRDRTIKVWDIERGVEVYTISGIAGSIESLAVSPEGESLFSASSNGPIQEWDLTQAFERQESIAHSLTAWDVDISADNRIAVTVSADKTLKVWNPQDGSLLSSIQTDHDGSVACVAISDDGQLAATGAGDSLIKIWDLHREKKVGTLRGHDGIIWDLKFVPHRNQIISASHDHTLRLWDLKRKKCVLILPGHGGPVETVTVTPNGRLAISGSADGEIRAWDLAKNQGLPALFGGLGGVLSLAVAADGRKFVSAHENGTIKVWNMEKLSDVRTFSGHTKSVESVIVTPDSQSIVSCSLDRTIRVWDIESGTIKMSFYGDSELFCEKITTDGKTLVAGENLGLVHFLRLEYPDLVEMPFYLMRQSGNKKDSPVGRILFSRAELDTFDELLTLVFLFLAESKSQITRREMADFNKHWAQNQKMKDSIFTKVLPELFNEGLDEKVGERGGSGQVRGLPIPTPNAGNKLLYPAIKFRAFLRTKLSEDEYRKFFTSFFAWCDAIARAIAGRYRGIGDVSKAEKSVRALNAAFPVDSDLKISAEELENLSEMFKK